MSFTKEMLTLWQGHALFIGHTLDTSPHQHYAMQISVGLERPFRLLSDDNWQEYRAIFINSNHSHQLVAEGWQMVLLVDPTLSSIQHIHTDQPVQPIKFDALSPILETLYTTIQTESCEQIAASCNQILTQVGGTAVVPCVSDPRIQQALSFMSEQPLKKVSTAAIAKAVFLSEGRFSHLFKEQMHIPIRRYLLWLRLMDAIENIVNGELFTIAAHEAGFADSAHLSRTFRAMFGLTLSDLFKNSQFIQVNICQP